MQLSLEHEMGVYVESLDVMSRSQFVKDMVLALEDELHEALAEVHWKPWSTATQEGAQLYKSGDNALFVSELVDALHFFLCLCLAAGATAEDIIAKYEEKHARNRARQASGYDDLRGKCRVCKAARDDLEAAGRDPEADGSCLPDRLGRRGRHDWHQDDRPESRSGGPVPPGPSSPTGPPARGRQMATGETVLRAWLARPGLRDHDWAVIGPEDYPAVAMYDAMAPLPAAASGWQDLTIDEREWYRTAASAAVNTYVAMTGAGS